MVDLPRGAGPVTVTSAARLSDLVALRPLPVRSANLELSSPSDLEGYVPTARSLDVVDRFARALGGGSRTRAWSITGPYGSGKSSLAVFLAALASPAGSAERSVADQRLRRHDPELADRLAAAMAAAAVRDSGCIRAIGTAHSGPMAAVIAGALKRGIRTFPRKDELPPDLVAEIADLAAGGIDSDAAPRLLSCLARLARTAPVLLVVDELGQALQYAVEHRRSGDFFLLQQVAEHASGQHDAPVFFFTLQHLSFADYLSAAGDTERREWGKVRGRFDDVPFIESQDHTLALIARTLEARVDGAASEAVRRWAADTWEALGALGLQHAFRRGVGDVAACFPLHPLTVLALPELCASYAQHERTLFSYLTSAEPGSVATFIQASDAAAPFPVVTLAHAYDYFIHSIRTASSEAPGARWLEIDRRIRETHGLAADDVHLLKSIGILNLISQGGHLRASKAITAYAVAAPDQLPDPDAIGEQMARLLEGPVTYRAFADDYRLWRGTDFNLARAVADERATLDGESPAVITSAAIELDPVTAVRHTQTSGAYRYFAARFGDDRHAVDLPEGAAGLVLYWVGGGEPTVDAAFPVVVLRPADCGPLVDACTEAAALVRVLTARRERDLDWVAQQELAERLTEARARSRAAFARAFDLSGPDTTVVHVGHAPVARSRRMSRIVSDVCDQVYSAAPEVRSEMLSRDSLTSQAARARRDLLQAMAERPAEPCFGIEGFGPERALYEAVFRVGGLHSRVDGVWQVTPPSRASSFHPAWTAIGDAIEGARGAITVESIEDALAAPPYGVPRSFGTILVAAYLASHSDEVGLFQDGSFQPALTPDVLERIVKIPSRFQVRDFMAAGAGTAEVLTALRRHLGITGSPGRGRRNASVLAVVAPLLGTMRTMPAYSLATRGLSREAFAVRECLLEAREPDTLLFRSLPSALGLGPVAEWPEGQAEDFAAQLAGCIREMRATYRRLLTRIRAALAEAFGAVDGDGVRDELGSRCAALGERELEPRLRTLALAVAADSLEDEEWITAIALGVSGRAPASWADADEERTKLELARLGRMFKDAEALAFATGAAGRQAGRRLVTVTETDGSQLSRVLEAAAPRGDELQVVEAVLSGERHADERAIQAALALVAEVLERIDRRTDVAEAPE